MSETTQEKSHFMPSASVAATRADGAISTAIVPFTRHERATDEAVPSPPTAASDDRVVELWLHGRPSTTQRVYSGDATYFRTAVGKPLRQVTLADLQAYADTLDASGLAPATRCRKLAAVKSLFAFAHGLGYTALDAAKPLRLPAVRETLSGRIVEEVDVLRMISLEREPRNHALLLMAYATGCRVSEISQLRWGDVVARNNRGGQITVLGKRGKVRSVLLPPSVFSKVVALRPVGADDNAPMFRSRRGRGLSPGQILRIVRRAAQRAQVSKHVVVHSLRHAHVSHALDRGAPIHLVSATVGHATVATTGRYAHARPGDSSGRYLAV